MWLIDLEWFFLVHLTSGGIPLKMRNLICIIFLWRKIFLLRGRLSSKDFIWRKFILLDGDWDIHIDVIMKFISFSSWEFLIFDEILLEKLYLLINSSREDSTKVASFVEYSWLIPFWNSWKKVLTHREYSNWFSYRIPGWTF